MSPVRPGIGGSPGSVGSPGVQAASECCGLYFKKEKKKTMKFGEHKGWIWEELGIRVGSVT